MNREDFDAFWPVFKSVIEARETYAFDPEMTLEEAYQLWCLYPVASYVAIENGVVLGSYYVKANAAGPGSHVCNCGYMVSPFARGKGVARSLCIHSQEIAEKHGFRAMQFNSVVSTNTVAVDLWRKLGFKIVGTLPKAYLHAREGYVDCHVMYKQLTPV
ncbi:GNAT family N-acetyltransferase [Parasalinivibrio latis]|uniref:GNAT family N-acetyltransferase n=1 Tax=Parasalinivibrio latis TaxID=2952610 RepID=UPI0030E22CAD